MACPICRGEATLHRIVDGVSYFACDGCDFIFADPELLASMDAGGASRPYEDDYWREEIQSSRERSFGSSLARFAEAVLYCRTPIQRVLDIGAGPGCLLQALQHQLPSSAHRFFAVEKFPPPETARAQLRHPENYVVGSVGELDSVFQLGLCIEVLEHLTPTMAASLFAQLRAVSQPGSLFLFNTGLTDYVRNEDPGYLDPKRRGHITSWSVRAARKLCEPLGFKVHALEGKTWAFLVEFQGSDVPPLDRIWDGPAENRALLNDPVTGSLMYHLGIEAARSTAFEHRCRVMARARQQPQQLSTVAA